MRLNGIASCSHPVDFWSIDLCPKSCSFSRSCSERVAVVWKSRRRAKRSVPTLKSQRGGRGAQERAFAHATSDSIRSKSALGASGTGRIEERVDRRGEKFGCLHGRIVAAWTHLKSHARPARPSAGVACGRATPPSRASDKR